MSKKVVVYRLKWFDGKIIETPRPTELAEEAAENVLKYASKDRPKWVSEKDLAKYGFDVQKSSSKKESVITQEATKPAPAKAEKKSNPFLTSVEDAENK